MQATVQRVPEEYVQNAICGYLRWKRYFFWRQNNTPVYDVKQRRFRKMNLYSMKGVSDLILIHEGHPYFIECKGSHTPQSDDQKEFQKRVEESGGTYVLARSVEDVQAVGL